MKSHQLLKALLFFTPLLCFSCSSWEEVAAPNEFKPLKITSVSPMTAKAGENIVITGENFIENKEFDQVWFGGNIRGNVDSATSTKLFLKVPQGAQTGALSVSNGVYSDTLKSAFTVVKESPFKTASISFGGIKFAASNYTSRYNGSGGYDDKNWIDSTIFTSNYTVDKSIVPNYQTLYSIGGCLALDPIAPFPDSVFQSFQEKSSNSGGYKSEYKYYFIQFDIDTAKQILTKLFIGQKYLFRANSPDECNKISLTLKNVPYVLLNSKIHVNLNATELKETFVSATLDEHRAEFSSTGIRVLWEKNRNIFGNPNILPDAYFELTLE